MLHLGKFVKTSTGRFLMSVLLGLGLATLFRTTCKGDKCSIFLAPIDMGGGDVYKYDGKCYRADMRAVKCDSKKTTYATTSP